MEQTNNSYPKFVSGQVLTSDSLNQAFGYLDQQTRLTRANLLGSGILQGLEYFFDNGSLVINSGVATTSDGYFIGINSNITYTVAVKASSLNRHPVDEKEKLNLPTIAYFLFKDTREAKRHGYIKSETKKIPNLNNYIVAIVVDFCAANKKIKCSEVSCDIVQTDHQIEYRPVLIEAGNVNAPISTQLNAIKAQCQTKRLVNMTNSTNVKLLNKKTKEVFSSQKEDLYYAAKTINQEAKNQAWQILLDQANPSITKFDNFCTHIKKFGQKMTEIPEYYLQHLDDLKSATNEFINFYNQFAAKYPVLPTNKNPYSRIVVLGKGNNSGNTQYRQQYCQSLTDKDFAIDREVLGKLFKRIFLLSENFIGGDFKRFRKTSCLMTWQLPSSKLGERSIPYYYNSNSELQTCWNPFQSPLYNQTSYYTSPNSENKTPMTDGNMMIHRHYGRYLKRVISDIYNYIKQNDLPINVITIKLHSKKLTNEHKKLIISNFSNEEKLKKINEFNSVLNNAYNLNYIETETMKNAAKKLDELITEKYGVPGTKSRNYQDRKLLAISALQSYLKLSHNEKCKNAIIIGGCPYYGNLILFHHNEHVLLSIGVAK